MLRFAAAICFLLAIPFHLPLLDVPRPLARRASSRFLVLALARFCFICLKALRFTFRLAIACSNLWTSYPSTSALAVAIGEWEEACGYGISASGSDPIFSEASPLHKPQGHQGDHLRKHPSR